MNLFEGLALLFLATAVIMLGSIWDKLNEIAKLLKNRSD